MNACIACLQYCRGRKGALCLFVLINALTASMLIAVLQFAGDLQDRIGLELKTRLPLFTLGETTDGTGFHPLSMADVRALRSAPWVKHTVAFLNREGAITVPGKPEFERQVGYVSASALRLSGATLLQGRLFGVEDERWRQAVISYEFWQTALDGRTDALGSSLDIAGERFRIVGILKDAPTWFPGRVVGDKRGSNHICLPIQAVPEMTLPAEAPDWIAGMLPIVYVAVAAPGVDNAGEAKARTQAWLNQASDRGARRTRRIEAVPGLNVYPRKAERTSQIIRALAGGVLTLIVAVGITSVVFLSTQAWDRRNEFALLRALGAGRPKLLSPVGALGVLLGLAVLALTFLLYWPNHYLLQQVSPSSTQALLERRSLMMLAIGAPAALLFVMFIVVASYWPVIRRVRPWQLFPVHHVIGRGGIRDRMGWLILLLQVTLATIAVCLGVNLSLRATAALQTGWGADTENVRVLRPVPDQSANDWEAFDLPDSHFWESLVTRLERHPGIQAAAVGTAAPGRPPARVEQLKQPGVQVGGGETTGVVLNQVSDRYFHALGLQVSPAQPSVGTPSRGALVSQAFMKAFGYASLEEVPTLIQLGIPELYTDLPIVGVVEDVKFASPFEQPRPVIYMPPRIMLLGVSLLVKGQLPTDDLIVIVNRFFQGHGVNFKVTSAPSLSALKYRYITPQLALTGFVLFVTLTCTVVMFLSCWVEVKRLIRDQGRKLALYRALGATRIAVNLHAANGLIWAGLTGLCLGALLFVLIAFSGEASHFLSGAEALFTLGRSIMSVAAAAFIVAALLLFAWQPLAHAIAREPGAVLADE